MVLSPAHPPILLVEDNSQDIDLTLRAFARRQLANPVRVARDGEEALAWLQRWDNGEDMPAVVLLDLKMPGLDGIEVLTRLKSHPVYRSIPVVVLSSSAEERDLRTAYRLGANSYIVKPVDFDQFIEVVGQIERYWCVTNRLPEAP